MPLPWVRSRSASTGSWDADDMSIEAKVYQHLMNTKYNSLSK